MHRNGLFKCEKERNKNFTGSYFVHPEIEMKEFKVEILLHLFYCLFHYNLTFLQFNIFKEF